MTNGFILQAWLRSFIIISGLFFSLGMSAQQGMDSSTIPPGTEADSMESTKDPFLWGDFTWIQGNNRQSQNLLTTRYFTGSLTLDCNYNYAFNHPIDHTTSGSTA